MKHANYLDSVVACSTLLKTCCVQDVKNIAQPEELIDFHHLKARRGMSFDAGLISTLLMLLSFMLRLALCRT